MSAGKKEQADFMENFWECCDYSLEGELYRQAEDSGEYRELSEEAARLYRKIEALLGEDSRLINSFDAAKAASIHYFSVPIYRQGFLDCVSLLRWLTVL